MGSYSNMPVSFSLLQEARVTEETRVQQVQGWMDLLGTRGPKVGRRHCTVLLGED